MRLHKSHISVFFLFVGGMSGLRAQYHSQLGIGNYGAVHSLYLNPSLHAYGAYNWQINLAGFWVNANNNYLSLRVPYSLYKVPNRIPGQYLTESGNPSFDKNWLRENLNGRDKFVSLSSDIYGPSASFKVKSWRFGIFTQASAGVRVVGVPENLAHAAFNEFDSARGAFSLFNGPNSSIGSFSSSGTSRAGLGLNVAKSIRLDWKREVLAGISIKKMWGFQGYHMNTSGISSRSVNSDSIVLSPTDINLVTYGDKIGHGWGVDLGVTYIFHKKDFKRHGEYAKNHTKYFSKVGFALMDIGSISYEEAVFRTVSSNSETGIKLSDAYSGSDYQQVLDSFMNEFGTYTSSTGNYKVGLPGRMVLNADFQVKKHFFVAGILSQSLRGRHSRHSRYQSFLMVSPRLEYRFVEVSLPTVLEYDYRSLRMGFSMRFGPLYFGTNSLSTFVNTRNVKDVDLFAGVAFGNLSEFSFKKLARSRSKSKSKANNCFSF